MTDSACSVPADLVTASGVTVVPMWVTAGERQWRDGEGPPDLLAAMAHQRVSTSCPSPGELVDAYRSAPDGPLVVLTVSRRMSGMFDAATVAARFVTDREVRVVDTGTAAGGQGLVVLATARAAASGAPLERVVEAAIAAAARVRLVATLPSLDTLARSGRVPNAAAWAGTWLGLHPLFEFRSARVAPLRPSFGRRAALDRLLALWQAGVAAHPGQRLHVCALHAMQPEVAQELLQRVEEVVEPACAFVGAFSAVMLVHTGPGVAGLSWWWEPVVGQ